MSPYPQCLYVRKASEIMQKIKENHIIQPNSTVRDVQDVFKRTRFGFSPIVEKIDNNTKYLKAVSSITIYDFLKLRNGTTKYQNRNFTRS